MQPRAPFGLLALVLGGAVGALIGIAIYKSVGAWVVPVGFIVGALIGLVLWTAMRPDRRRGPRGPGAADYVAMEAADVASDAGCMLAGCLGEGCLDGALGCSTLVVAALAAIAAIFIH